MRALSHSACNLYPPEESASAFLLGSNSFSYGLFHRIMKLELSICHMGIHRKILTKNLYPRKKVLRHSRPIDFLMVYCFNKERKLKLKFLMVKPSNKIGQKPLSPEGKCFGTPDGIQLIFLRT